METPPRHLFMTAVLLFLLFHLEAGAQELNMTSLACHCVGPYYCNSTNSCIGTPSDRKTQLACIVFKEFLDDGEVVEGALCRVTGVFDFEIRCSIEGPRGTLLLKTKNGVTSRTHVSYCCSTPFCNTEEALQEYIDGLDPTNLPPTFRPVTLPPNDTDVSNTSMVTDPTTASPTNFDVSDTPTTPTQNNSTNSASTESASQTTPTYAVVVIIVLGLTVIIILAIIVVVLVLHWYPLRFTHLVKGSSIMTSSLPVDSYSDPGLNELLEDSGSGSGLPLLIQRSISGQITLHNLIGKGRFGEVWKGLYKGDSVAVKIFHTKEESSWFHEVEVYQTCLLRHPNILRFIAADNKDVGLQMQLWLITEFCEFGSLFDLLSCQTFDQATALKLCFTAVCGIDHLHTEIFGTHGKPAIAHRDLKSRNILVKTDYTCCIADLGLSLTYEQATGAIKQPPRTTVGTKRYLAPEILTESIAVRNFESFKRSDIYSFGLVMWEIGRRAECNGHAEEAQLPYFDLIPSDPTLEEVRRLVCVERRRPSLPNPWNQHECMAGLAKIIRQCWQHEPEARLTSLRIKKSLANLRELMKDGKEQQQQT